MTAAPQRAQIARSTIVIDRLMTHFIKVGGILIIAAVFGIFIFIGSQILPLFRGATVKPLAEIQAAPGDYQALGCDEWTELPFLLRGDGTFVFLDLPHGGAPRPARPPFAAEKTFTALRYDARRQDVAFGTSDGFFAVVSLRYASTFAGDKRSIGYEFQTGPFLPIGRTHQPVLRICYAGGGDQKVAAAIQSVDGKPEVHVATLVQKRWLVGGGRIEVTGNYDLTASIEGAPTDVLLSGPGDALIVPTETGLVHCFGRKDKGFALRQTLRPFEDTPGEKIAAVDFLLADEALIFTSDRGRNVGYSLYTQGAQRLFGLTKNFPPLPRAGTTFVASMRNRGFLVTAGAHASLRFSTSESVRWADDLPFTPRLSALSGKNDRMLLLDEKSRLHVFAVHDPHPEASFKAYFGKVWYEGSGEPKYAWQSTGSTDEFEPKLSMVPLLIGTLKGTLYAMIFAAPLALLAGLYTSQFAHPNFRKYIKPVMEIMASLPSVILGFMTALWLAPMLEMRVPSFLLMIVALPLSAMGFGALWEALPYSLRRRIRPGNEFIVFAPVLVLVAYAAWSLGPALERALFVVQDQATGQPVADFRLWWPKVIGASFEQRNSLVVGFMMGFAVIPIIFTITEDALSNVPPAFRSASLALGASRWQTAVRVILPTASAGIFSALMIGFGRAIGETMIVLMATGNTPVMDFNIFSGMRTLSANIAVELPEAPHHGTLYRSLYLGAMLLFLMTFAINTLAELLRHHLREKYKAV
jgi:phosphate transport system permease protein